LSTLKEKTQVFAIGLLIGLLVAGVFFVFKLDDYFKELNFYKHFAENFSTEKKVNATELLNEIKEDKTTSTENSRKNKRETSQKVIGAPEENFSDKLIVSDSTLLNTEQQDDIVVKKDEMISSKTISIVFFTPPTKLSAKDSLLQRVSGINDDNTTFPILNVEFWQSPLNYKGYKLSKYKLIVYGLSATDAIKVYKLDDVVYLKNSNTTYKLDYSSDFKPYEKVLDESIISKLK